MKTKALYLDDSYSVEGTGTAVFVEFTDMKVDQSIFYPTTFGEPNDTGKVIIDNKEYQIVDTIYDGEYIHLISMDTYPQDIVGKTVKQKIDWDRRYIHMRFRTALKIISGLAYRKWKVPCRVNETYDDRAWIDIEKPDITEDEINEVMTEANEIVKKDLEVKFRYIGLDEFNGDEDLKKMSAHDAFDEERIRIMAIDGLPEQPEFGVNVKRTGEVGQINYKTTKLKGKVSNRINITLQ
ncbi:alanyl-tRNA editing protein [Thermoplasma sp. Kam2015]|uniref:alanyl-tRNA editing protein n=1 Tax=Thermoplasma sp. Kam2015 TaxID=2094122 RepID=UPI000D9F431B|nr:alanyl-tRNA editing protein [Thermoplasma sp. Kam2015]PYB68777.1 alanyl-tRNA editing protein [Thermoplasma sp. Kam2015]